MIKVSEADGNIQSELSMSLLNGFKTLQSYFTWPYIE